MRGAGRDFSRPSFCRTNRREPGRSAQIGGRRRPNSRAACSADVENRPKTLPRAIQIETADKNSRRTIPTPASRCGPARAFSTGTTSFPKRFDTPRAGSNVRPPAHTSPACGAECSSPRTRSSDCSGCRRPRFSVRAGGPRTVRDTRGVDRSRWREGCPR